MQVLLSARQKAPKCWGWVADVGIAEGDSSRPLLSELSGHPAGNPDRVPERIAPSPDCRGLRAGHLHRSFRSLDNGTQ